MLTTLEAFQLQQAGQTDDLRFREWLEERRRLTIDHTAGNGAEHRRSLSPDGNPGSIYHWLSKNGYPEGFRVLCFNCNLSRGIHGYCPHERSEGMK